MTTRHADDNATFYLIGGGIASLAAAAFLIRDGAVIASRFLRRS